MSEQIWQDRFTGTRYHCGDAWQTKVKGHLARLLHLRLRTPKPVAAAADDIARFWNQAYYQSLFPLRFGLKPGTGWLEAADLLKIDQDVYLDALTALPLCEHLLDDDALPPILPDPQNGEDGWLLVDRLLVESALLNILLAQTPGVGEEERQASRLAALTYPFHDELAESLRPWGATLVLAIGAVLRGAHADLPAPLAAVVRAVRDRQLGDHRVQIVLAAVQRIKQYVFETPGLNEIRGGSTLLLDITGRLQREQVDVLVGPEAVLRAAGSTLLFLAPVTDRHADWPARLRRAFFACTGAAFPAAAAVLVPAQNLLDRYGDTIREAYRALGVDRAQARQPFDITLPFETRCDLCKTRAADGWDPSPGEEDRLENRRPLCRVCKTKREVGRNEQRGMVYGVLADLGLRMNPNSLGVRGDRPTEWLAPDLASLIPRDVRRKLIGVVYGDGNNFGAVSMELPDIALGLQWAARVEETTRAAAALALGQATQRAARSRGWRPDASPLLDKVPFQVLALGGDDISLFAWAPVATAFAAEFTRLTDLEFAATSASRVRPDAHLTFSLGLLVTDEKTPVVKSVDFTERDLLGWAKQVAKGNRLNHGTIAMLYAQSAEGIPTSLEAYRRETYLLGAGSGFQLCTTLRPYSAEELRQLLTVAAWIIERGHLSRLQRLVGAFYGTRQGAAAGLLHYAYQRGRAAGRGWIEALEHELAAASANRSPKPGALLVNFSPSRPIRTPFGVEWQPANHEKQPTIWFSPLWDLMELAKLMS